MTPPNWLDTTAYPFTSHYADVRHTNLVIFISSCDPRLE